MVSPFSNLNSFKSSSLHTIFDPSKFQAMHFTFGINGGEERWEILISVTVALLKPVENYEYVWIKNIYIK
jgi:hypothetical protein